MNSKVYYTLLAMFILASTHVAKAGEAIEDECSAVAIAIPKCACFATISNRVHDGNVAGSIVMSLISNDPDKIQKAINEAMISDVYNKDQLLIIKNIQITLSKAVIELMHQSRADCGIEVNVSRYPFITTPKEHK